jgi:hypothetical protein
LTLFFDSTSAETRFHFEEYVMAHLNRRALEGSVDLVRFYVCDVCHYPVPDFYIKLLREKGNTTYHCPCGGTVPLAELRGQMPPGSVRKFGEWILKLTVSAILTRSFCLPWGKLARERLLIGPEESALRWPSSLQMW